ncbi:hypothetical protein M8C14_02180 [Bacillus subtilis subsp. subtilis]
MTSLALDNAKKSRQDQVPMQEMGMAKIQSDLINQYQATSRQTTLKQLYVELVETRKELTVEIGNPTSGEDNGSDCS